MKLVPSFALLVAAVLFSAIPGIGALSDAEMVSLCSVVHVLYMMLILLLPLLLCADTSWDYDMLNARALPLMLFRSFEETPWPRRDYPPKKKTSSISSHLTHFCHESVVNIMHLLSENRGRRLRPDWCGWGLCEERQNYQQECQGILILLSSKTWHMPSSHSTNIWVVQ